MCCLNFENQVYVDEIKRTPMPGSTVKVDGKLGNVTDANPLTGRLKVHLSDAPDGETVVTHRDQVVIISKKGGAEPTEDTEEKE
jgi:cell fate regulator YaaT (PSP1 superfamily)